MTRPTTSTPRPDPPSRPAAGELPDRLQRLEDESIHIIREVKAQFSNPVMLYSIGKDSSVMLHLARKAFHPGPIPWPPCCTGTAQSCWPRSSRPTARTATG